MGRDDDRGQALSPRVRRSGDVVLVGPHAGSAYVARVLTHLESVGFAGAPRWLGRTADGDDRLTYVEGEVPGEPPYDLDDDQLSAAAELVRGFHDAVAGTDLCAGAETVLHGDLGRTTPSSSTAGPSR